MCTSWCTLLSIWATLSERAHTNARACRRLDIRYYAYVFTSARCDNYGGGDMIAYGCTLAIHSRAFAESVVSYGIPSGPKSRLFDGDNMNILK